MALPAEARPLIRALELRRERRSSQRLFVGERTVLIISGVGREAAAAATEELLGNFANGEVEVLINVGLAGHRSRSLGQVLFAARVANEASGEVWDLQPSPGVDAPVGRVRTVDRPEREFPGDELFDMEAAAFCSTASRLAPGTSLQVLKVVSDNRECPARRLTAATVERLMAGAVPVLASFIESFDVD